jgi:DNA uptake protein ComE-like DNA-binding protein
MQKLTQNLSVALLAIAMLASCSQSSTESTTDEAIDSTATATTPEPTTEEVSYPLNANRATKEELLSIEQVTEEIADMIIEGRPYLNMTSFHTAVSAVLPDTTVEEFYKRVFVPINLNTADESEFLLVPGVGEKMAHEFEEYRPYTKVEQFRREIGKYVDQDMVAEYEKYVFVPANLNTATDEEFLAIPGVGQKMLHEFKEYRPYQNIEQFRREIGKYVSEDEVALFERYVTL